MPLQLVVTASFKVTEPQTGVMYLGYWLLFNNVRVLLFTLLQLLTLLLLLFYD